MWGTTPDQDNNNVAQPAPQLPGRPIRRYAASSHQIGVWSETRIFARGFLVVSGVLRRQQQMVDPAALA
jgi:hypothetical protein